MRSLPFEVPQRASRRPAVRGAALLTAMIIVAMVATMTATMVWQQWQAVQVEAAERNRAQSAWMLSGALDWARIILREDAINQGPDHLGEPWAVPLAEARLSTFLAADRDRTDDGPEAFLSGSIEDAQARYNLRNLIDGNQVVTTELAVLRRLCEIAGVSAEVASQIAAGLRDAGIGTVPGPGGGTGGTPGAGAVPVAGAGPGTGESGGPSLPPPNPDPPIAPKSLAQLGWLGIDAGALERLQPYVTLLPKRTVVNLNTAPREVVAASIDGLDLAGAERLVQVRASQPLRNLEDARKALGVDVTLNGARVGIASSFFVVRGRMRLDDRLLEERSLVERQGVQIVVLTRERISQREGTDDPTAPAR